MRWLPVFKKEMRLYFGSPVAYVVFTFFLLISGWFFSQIFLFYSDASMRSFMQPQLGGQNLNVIENVMRPLFTASRTPRKVASTSAGLSSMSAPASSARTADSSGVK